MASMFALIQIASSTTKGGGDLSHMRRQYEDSRSDRSRRLKNSCRIWSPVVAAVIVHQIRAAVGCLLVVR